MEWELREVPETQWQEDESGVYTLISWRPKEHDVRLDVMASRQLGIMYSKDDPVLSFAGSADAVRKWVTRWLNASFPVSLEHAAYIGSELQRALFMQTAYVQN